MTLGCVQPRRHMKSKVISSGNSESEKGQHDQQRRGGYEKSRGIVCASPTQEQFDARYARNKHSRKSSVVGGARGHRQKIGVP